MLSTSLPAAQDGGLRFTVSGPAIPQKYEVSSNLLKAEYDKKSRMRHIEELTRVKEPLLPDELDCFGV
jgi:hypothetical protein